MFGFAEHYRYGPPGAPSGAQMYLGDAWVRLDAMVKSRLERRAILDRCSRPMLWVITLACGQVTEQPAG